MQYCVGDAPKLAAYILRWFFVTPSDGISEELTRFLWNNAKFRVAVPFHPVGAKMIREGDYKNNFVYDKRTGLVFFDLHPGAHQLLMAYLQALHETPAGAHQDEKFNNCFSGMSAEDNLAERYVLQGHGLFLSSVGSRNRIQVGESFLWSSREERAFAGFVRQYI